MFGLLCFSFLVGLSYGLTPCCFPMQLEGNFARYGATFESGTHMRHQTDYLGDIHFDFVKKMRMVAYTDVLTHSTVKAVFDYNTYKSYTVVNNTGCMMESIPSNLPYTNCLPANATRIFGSSKPGAEFDVYRAGFGTALEVIGVTRKGCIPLSRGVLIPGPPTYTTENTWFVNMVTGNADPTIYAIPRTCTQTRRDIPKSILDEIDHIHSTILV